MHAPDVLNEKGMISNVWVELAMYSSVRIDAPADATGVSCHIEPHPCIDKERG